MTGRKKYPFKYKKNVILITKVLLIFCMYQMVYAKPFNPYQDYLDIVDEQYNNYFLDKTGKIHIKDSQAKIMRPVSQQNIRYYYFKAKDLIAQPDRFSKILAIQIWRDILFLPDNDAIHHWKAKVTRIMDSYRKAWGDIFTLLDKQIVYLRYEDLASEEIVIYFLGSNLIWRYPVIWDRHKINQYYVDNFLVRGITLWESREPMVQFVFYFEKLPLDALPKRINTQISDIDALQDYQRRWRSRLAFRDYKIMAVENESLDVNSFKQQIIIFPIQIRRARLDQAMIRKFEQQRMGINDLSQNQQETTQIIMEGREYFRLAKNLGYFFSWIAPQQDSNRYQPIMAAVVASAKLSN